MVLKILSKKVGSDFVHYKFNFNEIDDWWTILYKGLYKHINCPQGISLEQKSWYKKKKNYLKLDKGTVSIDGDLKFFGKTFPFF